MIPSTILSPSRNRSLSLVRAVRAPRSFGMKAWARLVSSVMHPSALPGIFHSLAGPSVIEALERKAQVRRKDGLIHFMNPGKCMPLFDMCMDDLCVPCTKERKEQHRVL